jgi:hypothetical protein
MIHREDQRFYLQRKFQDALGRFQPIELRHVEIEDGDVGLEFLAFLDGFISISRLGAYVPARSRFKQSLHTSSHQIVIVGNQYLQRRHINTFPNGNAPLRLAPGGNQHRKCRPATEQ